MLQEAGLQPPLSPPAPTEPPERPKFWGFWRKIPAWIYICFGVLGIAITLLEGYPWLSIREGPLLESSNPFTEMFRVVNDGYVPIYDVVSDCRFGVGALRYAKNNEVINSLFSYKTKFAPRLTHDDEATLPCFGILRGPDVRVADGATLSIVVSYSYWKLNYARLRRSQTFVARSIAGMDGSQHWIFIK
jgi:hypothetical protein